MDYFSYLSMTRKEDCQKSFIEYLMDILDYSEDMAIRESIIYYGGVEYGLY